MKRHNSVDKLEPYGSIFLLSGERAGPEKLEHEGRTLVRYMDRVYLPDNPSRLDRRAVEELSELRLILGPELIDSRYTQQVLARIYRRATGGRGGLRVIDFGCGDGNIAALLLTLPKEKRPSEVVGVDLSRFAADLARERLGSTKMGTAIAIGSAEGMQIEDSYFDGGLASFVLHFPVHPNQVRDIFRVLKPGAKFVYNNYLHDRDQGYEMQVVEMFRKVGFSIRRYTEKFYRIAGQKTEIVEQRFVECVRPS
jgi:ubiquinone/menaquinone biosynthesis C-methylase UbiE